MARFVETLNKQIAEGVLPDVEFDYILRAELCLFQGVCVQVYKGCGNGDRQ